MGIVIATRKAETHRLPQFMIWVLLKGKGNNMEVWKDVVGYEGLYQVSNLGRVKSLPKKKGYGVGYTQKEKLLKIANNGAYLFVRLGKNGTYKNLFVHRMVAQAFIPNTGNKCDVNHKNGIKTDNRMENLEWNTRQENIIHSYKNGLQKWTDEKISKIEKRVICLENKQEYDSIKKAAEQTGINRSNIVACCKGRRTTAGGYHWKHKEA